MPATVFHSLSATTPDNPSYEIRPSHWNTEHLATIAAVGSEISGAFSNAGNVSFGYDGTYITATANAAGAGDGFNRISAGTQLAGTNNTISFADSNGISFGLSNSSIMTASHNGLTTAALSNHSHGNPTLNLTNLSGTTASNSAGLTLSLSAAAPGAATLTVSAVGNTTVNSSGTWANAVSLRAYGVLSAGTSNGSLLLSTPDPVDYTYLSVGNSNLGNTAGDTGVFSQRVVLVGSNNITLSGSSNGGSVTLSIIGGAGGGYSAGVSNVGNTSGNTGLTGSNLVLSGGNGVTLSQSTHANGGTVGFSVATSYAASNHSHGDPTLALTNLSGTTASNSAGLTLSLSAAAPGAANFSVGVSNVGNTAGDTGVTGTRIVYAGGNNMTLSQATDANGATITFSGANSHAQQTGISGMIVSDATYTSGTVSFSGQNNITIGSSVNGASQYIRLSVGNYITTARASTDAIGLNTAQTNVTWTANSSGLSINAAGYAGTATALTGAIAATVNSGGVSVSVPATSSLVGASGLSISSNGSTISVYEPARSSFQNIAPHELNQSMTFNGASVSHAVAFNLPHAGSFSFLRIPVLMTTNQTTIATTAATRNVSGAIYSTWNAVVYSLGTGASSRSLQSVASGSSPFTFMNSLSIAVNGTQYSVTQGYSYQAEGGAANLTTQYSISNTNYSLTTNQIATNFSTARFLDINFANSLSAGPYWLVFGYSSSSATNSAGAWTDCNVRYSNHYGASGQTTNWGVMGSTNYASGGANLGVGSFSTAGGGTTASIPISAISSSASHVVPMFQLLRSA